MDWYILGGPQSQQEDHNRRRNTVRIIQRGYHVSEEEKPEGQWQCNRCNTIIEIDKNDYGIGTLYSTYSGKESRNPETHYIDTLCPYCHIKTKFHRYNENVVY